MSTDTNGLPGVWMIHPPAAETYSNWPQRLAEAKLLLRGRIACDAVSLGSLRPASNDVLLLACSPSSALACLEILVAGQLGLVLLNEVPPWLDQVPAVVIPEEMSSEGLRLAVLSAAAVARRTSASRHENIQLQARLNDRIVLERAKELLAARLGVREREAFRRLRAEARRQRKSLRELAQAVLDSETLLDPDSLRRPETDEVETL